jgi:hypothetical protein
MGKWMQAAAVMAAVVSVAFAAACKDDEEDEAGLVAEAADSTEMVHNEGALLSVAMEGSTTQSPTVVLPLPATPEDAAQKAADRMKARLSPDGCVTTEVSGATLTATLNECTGRLGLRQLTGTITVVFSIESDGVHADATATGLKVNRATMDIQSKAVRWLEGTQVTTAVHTTGTGTGPRGKQITRDGDYSITYDLETECRTLVGEWKTTVGENEWTTQVTALKRCKYGCPEEGGKIVHSNSAKERTITVNFDGSATAAWSSSTGKTGTVDLTCEPGGT